MTYKVFGGTLSLTQSICMRPQQAGIEGVVLASHHLPYQVQDMPAHVPCSHSPLSVTY